MKMISIAFAVALALLPGTSFAQAGSDEQHSSHCFFATDFGNWKAPDDKTIYIRVRTYRVFRLDLAGRCPMLKWPGAVLVTKFSGSTTICHPIDWNLEVADSPERAPHACIVRAMSELSPDEVSAIPKEFRP